MLSKKLRRIIMIAIMVTTLFTSIVHANAPDRSRYTYRNSTNITYMQENQQEEKIEKPRVLIYHSHFHETYKDATIYQVGEDLTRKLEAKGLFVEHVDTNFSSRGYDYCYGESRKMLLSKDLNQYSLLIDLHRDSSDNAYAVNVNGNRTARTMFVGAKENPNRMAALSIINTINNELDRINVNIHKSTVEKHRKVNFYNAELSSNAVLLELGNEKNSFEECSNTCTYLSEAISNYIYNK